MEHRIFGKELTNLNQIDFRNRKSYSQAHSGNLKDLTLNTHRPNFQHAYNKSLVIKENNESALKKDTKDPQLVPQYFNDNLDYLRKQEK